MYIFDKKKDASSLNALSLNQSKIDVDKYLRVNLASSFLRKQNYDYDKPTRVWN